MPNREFSEVLRDSLVSLGVTAAFAKFTEKWTEHTTGQFQERVLDPALGRVDLLLDIQIMSERPKKEYGGRPLNILRRYEAAINERMENRFVALLIKIPKDSTHGRRKTLQYLNGISDQEFTQALYLLDHDVIAQAWERCQRTGTKILGPAFEEFKKEIRAIASDVRTTVDTGVNEITDSLSHSANWLEERENERRGRRGQPPISTTSASGGPR